MEAEKHLVRYFTIHPKRTGHEGSCSVGQGVIYLVSAQQVICVLD